MVNIPMQNKQIHTKAQSSEPNAKPEIKLQKIMCKNKATF